MSNLGARQVSVAFPILRTSKCSGIGLAPAESNSGLFDGHARLGSLMGPEVTFFVQELVVDSNFFVTLH